MGCSSVRLQQQLSGQQTRRNQCKLSRFAVPWALRRASALQGPLRVPGRRRGCVCSLRAVVVSMIVALNSSGHNLAHGTLSGATLGQGADLHDRHARTRARPPWRWCRCGASRGVARLHHQLRALHGHLLLLRRRRQRLRSVRARQEGSVTGPPPGVITRPPLRAPCSPAMSTHAQSSSWRRCPRAPLNGTR